MTTADIVVVGSLNVDLVVSVPRFPESSETVKGNKFRTFFGGKGGKQAVAAARLGGRVAMIGSVGRDDFGETQIQNLKREGINVGGIRRTAEHSTGTALIEVDQNGDNRIVVVPGANGALRPEHVREYQELLRLAKVVLVQLEIPMETVSAVMDAVGCGDAVLVLDPAPATKLPEKWLGQTDYLTPNLGELGLLLDRPFNDATPIPQIVDGAGQLISKGVRNVLVKLGCRGALWMSEGNIQHWPGHEVKVVDTTAAGDCFNGALAVGLAKGWDVNRASQYAVAASAVAVTRAGAQDSLPDKTVVATALGRVAGGR